MNEEPRDTVSIDDSVHNIYKRLTEGNDPVDVPFQTMKDVFMWAARLGISARRTQTYSWETYDYFSMGAIFTTN